MGLHSEATLDRRFVEFARQMNAYLSCTANKDQP